MGFPDQKRDSQAPITLLLSRHLTAVLLVSNFGIIGSIHHAVNRTECHCAPGHEQGAGRKHHDPPSGRQGFEERIRIPAVVAVTLFDPEPVRERQKAAEQQRARERDGPRRGEEEEVKGEDDGWDEVESEV